MATDLLYHFQKLVQVISFLAHRAKKARTKTLCTKMYAPSKAAIELFEVYMNTTHVLLYSYFESWLIIF